MTHSFPTRRSSDLVTVEHPRSSCAHFPIPHGDTCPAYWPKVNPAASAATRANATGADQAGFATSRCHAIGCLRVPAGTLAERMAIPYNLRSEEHTSELQSLMRISYAVFCLK